jgi:hypothetical protein
MPKNCEVTKTFKVKVMYAICLGINNSGLATPLRIDQRFIPHSYHTLNPAFASQ